MRPDGALITSTLPVSGVKFQWDLETIRARGARDAANEQLLVLINWADREEFLKEVVGHTAFNKDATLLRVLPLKHPLRPTFFCEEYELADYGHLPERRDLHDPVNNNAPVQDWARYLLTFTRPRWRLFTDAQLRDPALFGIELNFEQYRYTWMTDLPNGRNRRASGFPYEYLRPDGTWAALADEAQFIPDYTISLVCNWVQVPFGAVPYQAILDRLNTVNQEAIRLTTGGRVWGPEQLAFKGLAKPIEQYTGADGERYVDLAYSFEVVPGGWNNYLIRDAAGNKDFRPIRLRVGPGAGFPPFPLAKFQQLFIPG